MYISDPSQNLHNNHDTIILFHGNTTVLISKIFPSKPLNSNNAFLAKYLRLSQTTQLHINSWKSTEIIQYFQIIHLIIFEIIETNQN